MAALQYLETLKNTHPELTEWYNTLSDLYQKKLWHQLTLKLDQFVSLAVFQVPPFFFISFHFFKCILGFQISKLNVSLNCCFYSGIFIIRVFGLDFFIRNFNQGLLKLGNCFRFLYFMELKDLFVRCRVEYCEFSLLCQFC